MFFLFVGDLLDVGRAAAGILCEQVVADFGDEGGIAHPDDRLIVMGSNLDCRVRLARGGAADEEGLGEAALLHLGSVGDHLVE